MGGITSAAASVVFRDWADDFGDGLGGWFTWGSPLPQRLASFQGRAGVFDNNGDGMHSSGVSSLELFACPHGFALESEVFLSITNPAGCHCDAYVGLTRKPEVWPNALGSAGDVGDGLFVGLNYAGDGCWGTPAEWRRHLWLLARFWSEDGTWVTIEDELPRANFQCDDLGNRWVRLEVIVEADRSLRFVADGREIWRPRARLHPEVLTRQRVVAWGRSLGTAGKAYHDWVRLRAAGEGQRIAAGAVDTPAGTVVAWTRENWEGAEIPAQGGVETLSLAAVEGGERAVRSRRVVAGPLAFSCEVQPLLRSTSDGRDRARVGLVGRFADGRDRFVGVELAGGEAWLIDTARPGALRRVRRMAGFASGKWQEFSFRVERPMTFGVVGARMESFVYDLGAWPASGWQVEAAVADSGDGVRLKPVRFAVAP